MFIEIKDLSKSFKIFKRKPGLKGALESFFKRNYFTFTAIENINLNINKGEIIGILGNLEYLKYMGIRKINNRNNLNN